MTTQKSLERFRLLWGLAPKGSLKYRKGKDIESLFKQELERAYEEGVKSCVDKKGLK